jgi:hypothetical protein
VVFLANAINGRLMVIGFRAGYDVMYMEAIGTATPKKYMHLISPQHLEGNVLIPDGICQFGACDGVVQYPAISLFVTANRWVLLTILTDQMVGFQVWWIRKGNKIRFQGKWIDAKS